MVKTAIIVIASREDQRLNDFIKEYWLPFITYIKNNSIYKKFISIYLLFGNSTNITDLSDYSENIIVAPYSESLENIYYKTIYAFEQIKKYESFDFVFRTNLSSYLIIDKFMHVVQNLPLVKTYSGVIGGTSDDTFVSGAGFFLSKDLVDYCITYNKFYCQYDDVNFGEILKEIPRLKQERKNIISCQHLFSDEQLNTLYEELLVSQDYHIRLKNPNKEVDIQVVSFLTKKFYKD